jgi:hypothetical protein
MLKTDPNYRRQMNDKKSKLYMWNIKMGVAAAAELP